MDFGLKGKTALVLGGSKGLGLGIASALAGEGVRVALTSRDEGTAEAAAAELGSSALGLACDTARLDEIDRLHDLAIQRMGSIDILVLNSGGPPAGSALSFQAQQYRDAFDGLFLGPVHLAAKILPGMAKAGFGRIIAVGSSGIIEPIENLAISNTIRPALAGWIKTVAREVAASGVTANLLVPGRIFTDRVTQLDGQNAERTGRSLDEVRQASHSRIPVGRYGTVDEFGAAAAYLASAQAAFITGSILRVDGGQVSSIY
jgi:3-oxoacyl-[acyl-carrier protein] reductase